MSSPRTVKQVAKETGWLNEKFLKHLAKNYSGKEFTLDSLKKDPVISKFMEPSKKTKKESKPRAQSSSPMKFLKENPETPLKFVQENPKKSGTKSHGLYEKYKVATTYTEFKDLGGGTEQLLWDYRKGYLQIDGGDIENFTPAEKKTKSPPPKAKKTSKKSSPKKEKKKNKEKKEKDEKPVDLPPIQDELEEDQSPPAEEPEQEEITETPVEEGDSDDSDEEDGGFNPFNLTADDSEDGEDSD